MLKYTHRFFSYLSYYSMLLIGHVFVKGSEFEDFRKYISWKYKQRRAFTIFLTPWKRNMLNYSCRKYIASKTGANTIHNALQIIAKYHLEGEFADKIDKAINKHHPEYKHLLKIDPFAYTPQYIFSYVKPSKAIIFAQSYPSLLKLIPNLPHNCDYDCFIFDSESNIANNNIVLPNKKISIQLYDLLEDLCYEHSPLDMEAAKYIKTVSSLAGYEIEKKLKESFGEIFTNLDSDIIGLEAFDNMYQLFRRYIGFIQESAKYENVICVSDKKTDLIDNISQSIFLNQSGKNVFVYYNDFLSFQNMEEYYTEKLKQRSLTAESKTYSEFELKSSRANFINQIDKREISLPDNDYVLYSTIPKDANYRNALISIGTRILQTKSLAVCSNEVRSHEYRDTIKELKKAVKSNNSLTTLTSDSSHTARILKETSTKWLDAILEEIFTNIKASGILKFADNDISLFYYHCLTQPLKLKLLNLLHLDLYLDKFFATRKPNYIILSPGRNSIGWMICNVAKKHYVKTIDYQVVVQSGHPKYFPSKANVMTFMETDQINIYREIFSPKEIHHDIKLLGSVIFDKIKEKKINKASSHQALISSLGFESDDKIVFIATQYSNGKHFLEIIKCISALAEELSFNLVVKIHPREKNFYIKKFQEVIDGSANSKRLRMVEKDHNLKSLIFGAEILVTLFSNVGLMAAANDVDVLVPNLIQDNLPIDFPKMGIAVGAYSSQEVKQVLRDLLNNGAKKLSLHESRKAYIQENQQIFAENPIEELLQFIEQEIAIEIQETA